MSIVSSEVNRIWNMIGILTFYISNYSQLMFGTLIKEVQANILRVKLVVVSGSKKTCIEFQGVEFRDRA